jgi:predicted dienelactone hydrolase
VSSLTSVLEIATVLAGLAVGQNASSEAQRPAPIASARGSSAGKVELPAPTGQYRIGTRVYNWVDHSRRELASKDASESRQVIVQVWYPTEDRSGPAAPYVPALKSYRNVWPESQVDLARRTLTHSQQSAKPKPGMQFAVVLLSRGWEGTRSEYTSVAEDLASHGYAVFGVDHRYMGRMLSRMER